MAVSDVDTPPAVDLPVESVPTTDMDNDVRRLRRARLGRRIYLALVAVFVVCGLVGLLGPANRSVSSAAGGRSVQVDYPHTTRGGLAASFSILLTDPDGFADTVTVRVSEELLSSLDEHGLDPQPARATSEAGFVEWTFDAPAGTTLAVSLDARIETGRAGKVQGWVEVVGPEPLRVETTTWILP